MSKNKKACKDCGKKIEGPARVVPLKRIYGLRNEIRVIINEDTCINCAIKSALKHNDLSSVRLKKVINKK